MYDRAARAGCARALRCLIVPALSLANGIESDSVLDVDYKFVPGENKMCGVVPPSTSADVCGLNLLADTQCGSAEANGLCSGFLP